jgi:hypothetical protein
MLTPNSAYIDDLYADFLHDPEQYVTEPKHYVLLALCQHHGTRGMTGTMSPLVNQHRS